jgi:hypothetical protein
LTNFDHDSQVMNVTAPLQTRQFFFLIALLNIAMKIPDFPWCGFLIDMSDLSVLADYGRYHDICVSLACLWPSFADILQSYSDK